MPPPSWESLPQSGHWRALEPESEGLCNSTAGIPELTVFGAPHDPQARPSGAGRHHKVPRVGLHGVEYPLLIPSFWPIPGIRINPLRGCKLLEEHRGSQSESCPHAAGVTG